MKKFELLSVAEGGILTATNKTLEAAHAYKTVKLRKEVKAAFDKYLSDEQALLKENGIDDPESFDAESKALSAKADRTEEEQARLDGMRKQIADYKAMRGELLNEDVVLDCKVMPYEQWHKFVVENDIKPNVEDALEGIIWKAPEE